MESSAPVAGHAGLTALPAVAAARGAQLSVAGRAGMRRAIAEPTCSAGGTTGWVAPISGSDNVAAGAYASVAGGSVNYACGNDTIVGAGVGNGIDAASLSAAILGGQDSAIVAGYESTIAGGGQNTVKGGFAFIGGGYNNAANGIDISDGDSAIGGGDFNTTNAQYDFIGAGNKNTVSGVSSVIGGGQSNVVNAQYGTVAGGEGSKVANGWGTIGGGYGNQAGEIATVPGGKDNVAGGEGSFAAGVGSTAGYAGDFVWSDFASGATALKGTAANQFLARASGGVTFYSSPTLASGVKLAAGSGTWSSLSDRNAKSGISSVSDDGILAKVSTLPISEWSYTTERGVRHVGPMAQDFYAAFNVGEDDRHITSIDEDGVALAAIKALNARVVSLKAEAARKDATVRDLQRRMAALEARVDALTGSR